MYRYVGRRLLQSLVVLAGLSVLLFTLLVYTPGDPVEIIASTQPDIRAEDIARLRRYYGLDDPVWVRYVKWVRTVGTGDLGISGTYGQPVTRLIRQRLGNTLQLLTAAFLIAFTIGVTVGIYSALHQYSAMDYLATLLSFAGLAMPVFWLGLNLILIFAVRLHLLPAFGSRTAEQFGVVLLDTKHRVIRTAIVASGSLNATVVQPRDVYREAILGAAAAVVVFHNHPSGDPTPSPDDFALTRRLIAAGVLIGVDLVDHLILGDVRYWSFKEMGKL